MAGDGGSHRQWQLSAWTNTCFCCGCLLIPIVQGCICHCSRKPENTLICICPSERPLSEQRGSQGSCTFFYTLVAWRMPFRSDLGICWKWKGQEEVRKDTVNTVSSVVEDIAARAQMAQSLKWKLDAVGSRWPKTQSHVRCSHFAEGQSALR